MLVNYGDKHKSSLYTTLFIINNNNTVNNNYYYYYYYYVLYRKNVVYRLDLCLFCVLARNW